LRIIIETYKHRDGEGLGTNKVGEGSGENEGKIGDIPEPPKTNHKNAFVPKPNHLRNRLDTTQAPPMFPPQTNDFQKPIKFMRTLGNVLFGKESEKPSGEKPVEKPSEEKPVEKSSGEKPNEQPHPMPNPQPIRFHCGYCGRDGHKDEFYFKRRRDERMAKEWVNKDKYHPSNGVLEPRVQMPRAKESVRTVSAWGSERLQEVLLAGLHWSDRCATPVTPVQVWADRGLVFVPVMSLGLVQEVVVLVVGLKSLQVVSL
jgi:hypothetical protein